MKIQTKIYIQLLMRQLQITMQNQIKIKLDLYWIKHYVIQHRVVKYQTRLSSVQKIGRLMYMM